MSLSGSWRGGFSIRGKLLAITVTVLILGALAGTWLVAQSYRDGALEGARVSNEALASTIAEYAVAFLREDDARGASAMLGKLSGNAQVTRATLFDARGRVFARYERPGGDVDEDRRLVAAAPVLYDGARVGELIVETSTVRLDRRIAAVVQRIAIGSVALVVLCALLALRLQRWITGPLARLSLAMQRVGEQGYLSERVTRRGTDEISMLFTRFNGMLDQLQQRGRERDRTQLWLRTLIESLPDQVFVFDEMGRMIEVLQAEDDQEALPLRAPTGLQVSDLLPEPVASRMLEAISETLRSGKQVRIDYDLDHTDHAEHYEAVLTPLGAEERPNGEARLVLGLSRDVTERWRLQDQFLRSQKMEAVGQLAGGVAHDFNNLLTGIIGYAELIQQLGESPASASAEQILHISERAADLVRQLLAFSRKAAARHRPTDTNDLLRRVQGILTHTLDPRITLKVHLSEAPCSVLGDASQLESAVLNLAVNARDAMPQGGTLSLTTRVVELDAGAAAATGDGLPAGAYVEVAVADSGEGVPDDLLGRIFEPFFTTKDAGKGTGLGLAAVYGTATSHRGAVQVRSQVGQGSVFRLFLPLAADVVDDIDASPVSPGSGRLVLLDDEEGVRLTAATLLGRLGYQVEAFASPREAIGYFEQHHDEVDGVILDMVMPQMSGVDVARRLREIRPDVGILIASGYVGLDSQLPDDLADLPAVNKPFTIAELASAVGSLLGTVAAAGEAESAS